MSRVCVIFIVLVIGVQSDDCPNYDGRCYACTHDRSDNCGFCSSSGKCSVGTGSGPRQGSCSGTWHFDGYSCPTPPPTPMPPPTPQPARDCDQYNDHCFECTQDAGAGDCGFCSSTKTCTWGTQNGPRSGTCSGTWAWTSGKCPTPVPTPQPPTPAPTPVPPTTLQPARECGQYNSKCTECTTAEAGDCGFCDSTGLCSEGNGNGPFQGTCNSTWAWEQYQCPTPAPTPQPAAVCGQYDNECYACTNDASVGDCGFCSSTGKCVHGKGQGPIHGSCSGTWHWDGVNCPTPAPITPAPPSYGCKGLATCDACTNAASGRCGYCKTTSTCESGIYQGPYSGNCTGTDWVWYSPQCPASRTKK